MQVNRPARGKRGRTMKVNRELSRDTLAQITSETSRGDSREERETLICMRLHGGRRKGRKRTERRIVLWNEYEIRGIWRNDAHSRSVTHANALQGESSAAFIRACSRDGRYGN